ncbi:MAG: hypothetical protein IJI73_02850, partial [Kiritimatiellae bacterium]|nr:hypothetical protein [Kiritimatiellia bacterium]
MRKILAEFPMALFSASCRAEHLGARHFPFAVFGSSRRTASGETIRSTSAKRREKTGSGSARSDSTDSLRGTSRRAEVGVGSFVSVACLSLVASA